MANPLPGQGTQRQGSLRSVASNSSIASGTSLTRRARTRARSKTLTGGSSARSDKLQSPISELPYLDKVNVQEPLEQSSPSPLGAPPRPPRSPHRTETMGGQIATMQASGDDSHSPATELYVEDPQSYPMPNGRLSRQTSGLQMHPTASQPEPPPSAFSRDPSLTRINMAGANVRDSMSTQKSGMSSSIYPPSTSTASGPDSPPSPRSMVEQDDNYDVSSYDPELGDVQEYDGDDVAYRLRLLVKNNYFLPPAHSKPSASDFAPTGLAAPKKPARSTTPTFMDLFRGKSRSKPTTPMGGAQGFDPNMPALRTAADSITASFALRPQPRSSSQIPRHTPLPGDRSGRVVVVREKMHDLAVAAKQAEQDMKARGIRLDSASQLGPTDAFHDVIDPTDAVDLPPPSSTYPFAVQASALHGLGVQDSVGAALLADRLPPPGSPGMSDPEDDWRKALLHQAVHHSLDSTSPDVSSFSMLDASTPLPSPKSNPTGTAPRGANPKRLLEQRILTNPMLSDASPPQLSRKKSSHSQVSLSRSKEHSDIRLTPLDTSRPTSYLPLRADTPIGPLTPLTPPPRKYLVNPLYSLSQTDLPRPNPPRQSSSSLARPPPPSLRKTVSSPMISDTYESDARHMMLTPPPLPVPPLSARSSFQDISGTGSFETSREHPMSLNHASSESQYSEDDILYNEALSRASMAMSAINDGRPSFSEYSQSSPTASAFRDNLYQGSYQSATSYQQPSRPSVEQQSARESPILRYSAMSPPPRISSSLAHFALSPPPRSSSFHHKTMASRIPTTPPVSEHDHSSSNQPLTDDTTMVICAPEPTTPPFPIPERRGHPSRTHLSLDIPPTNIPVAIHSAPGPSSPTSFFDSIQAQPNAMDDLDSSSGESEDEDEGDSQTPPQFMDIRTPATSKVSVAPRPPIMRLGNHSTPYVGRVIENRRPSLPSAEDDSRKPIGNIPVRAPFFTERSGKSDQGHGPPASTYDFYKYTQQHRPVSIGEPSTITGKRRSATIGPVAEWRNHQKAQESLRRLDGMLIQHMETEKDTIKRIATSVRSNIATQKSGQLYS